MGPVGGSRVHPDHGGGQQLPRRGAVPERPRGSAAGAAGRAARVGAGSLRSGGAGPGTAARGTARVRLSGAVGPLTIGKLGYTGTFRGPASFDRSALTYRPIRRDFLARRACRGGARRRDGRARDHRPRHLRGLRRSARRRQRRPASSWFAGSSSPQNCTDIPSTFSDISSSTNGFARVSRMGRWTSRRRGASGTCGWRRGCGNWASTSRWRRREARGRGMTGRPHFARFWWRRATCPTSGRPSTSTSTNPPRAMCYRKEPQFAEVGGADPEGRRDRVTGAPGAGERRRSAS